MTYKLPDYPETLAAVPDGFERHFDGHICPLCDLKIQPSQTAVKLENTDAEISVFLPFVVYGHLSCAKKQGLVK